MSTCEDFADNSRDRGPRPTQFRRRWLVAVGLFLLLAGCGGAGQPPVATQLPGSGGGPVALSTPVWYVIADAGGGGGGNDRLYSVDITLPVPQNAQTAVGPGTGTDNIEGAAFWPGTDTLYAFNSDRLGAVHLTTGVFAQVVNKDVWDDGNNALLVGLDKNRNAETLDRRVLSDIDSVAFDPNTGFGYAVARVSGADLLFRFDRDTGFVVRGAFQIGAATYDYFRVPPVEVGNEDIDDIAIDPYDGQLFGIANGGGRSDRLVRIDKFDGTSSDVGLLGVEDMEGFAFFNDSSMWGVTGSRSNNAADGSTNDNAIFSLNRVTGEASDRRPLSIGGSDFESMAFLTADLNEFCGRVWCDDDGNGTQDAGENGVPNVTLVLWRDVDNNDVLDAETDIPLVSTVTDAAGDYCFGVASTGDYVITVLTDTLPPDFVLSQADALEVSVAGFGNTVNGLDFVKRGAVGSLGDVVFLDVEGDGTQDIVDPGLRGVVVRLVDPGPDGLCGTADDVVLQSTTTDGGGYYTFEGLGDGAYCLDVDESSLPPASTLTTGNEPHAATVVAGSNDLGGDFGYQFPGRVGDLVWLDVDGNGLVDAGEPGLGGVSISISSAGADGLLETADDVLVSTVVTAGDGSYEFGGLTPGAYSVAVNEATTPGGTTRTTFANPVHVLLTQGRFVRDADFGYVGDAAIGDRVWNDLDGDGSEDAGEPGLAGVRVLLTEAGLDGTHGTADDVGFPPQITAADGSYRFPGLIAGLYSVQVDDTTLPGAIETLTTGNAPLPVPLAQGEEFTAADFGFKQNDASIGDRVWNDLNGDGVDDVGEPGLAGVDVTLRTPGPDGVFSTADDVTVATQTTAADGSYDFLALPPGTYRVDVDAASLPVGFGLTTGNDPVDLVLAGSEVFDTADFGYWVAASVGDRLWDDLNGDGLQDAGEPGLAGVDLDLIEAGPDGVLGTGDDRAVGSTTTLGDGSYGFAGLPPGLYRVDVDEGTLAPGYVLSSGNEPLDRTVAAGEVVTNADIGYWLPGSLGDEIWDDLNGDGLRDAGEPGLLGVRVDLTEAGVDGALGTPDDVGITNTTTDAAGLYRFGNLPAGRYRIDVDQGSAPAGFALTTGNDPMDLDLAYGVTDLSADFGFWRSASVGDRVWNDLDGDGVQDAGEPGLVGLVVELTEAGVDGLLGTGDDVSRGTQATGLDGSYGFLSLAPGLYRLSLDGATVPAGMLLTGGTDPADLVLAPGDGVSTVDFGLQASGRLGDLVWDDVDGDGIQDAGEPGLPGIIVRLIEAGPDGLCGTADDVDRGFTTTAADGSYAFNALPGGTYCVLVDGGTVPAGFVPTSGTGTQTVVVPPGGVVPGVDFGFRQVAGIGDFIWHDLDDDGVQDAGEPGLAGVRVDLIEAGPDGLLGTADDVTFPPTTTAADGSYGFTSLLAGLYRVRFDGSTVPAGMQLTTSNAPYDATVAAGVGDAQADFGLQFRSAIEGQVWEDLDGDTNVDAGEAGIVSVALDLIEAGLDGVLGTPDDVTFAPDVTVGPGGDYRFEHLPPGTYRVVVQTPTIPAGMALTTGNQPFDVVIPSALTTVQADFGYRHTGRLGDRVYNDLNANGVEDAGEAGLPGVQVDLIEAGPDGLLGTADDVSVGSRSTDGTGAYAFENLAPGVYRVSPNAATLPAGTALSAGTVPTDLTLLAGQSVDTVDFGFRSTGVIGDRLWQDLNGDGMQDAGEPGLSGVTLNLLGAGVDGVLGTADDVSFGTASTAPDGSYGFLNLPGGSYRVVVDTGSLPAGMLSTTGGTTQDVVLAAGEVLTTADFGFQFVSAIGDRVYHDLNANGVEDAGEAGLPGVQVDLIEAGPDGLLGTADDVSVGSRNTDGTGAYAFDNLPPGVYRVNPNAATLPAGTALSAGSVPTDLTLLAGQSVDTVDFGFRSTGVIGDRLWQDLNGDGVQDAGEPGLSGVTLNLLGAGIDGLLGTADDVSFGTASTAPDGSYGFLNLPGGSYRVAVDTGSLPAGMLSTTGGATQDVVLAAGEVLTTADFGFQFASSIGDRVWDDLNANGVQDAGEPGLAGVTLLLSEAGVDGILGTADDVALGSAATDPAGAYAFGGLAPGLYRVEVVASSLPPDRTLTAGPNPRDIVLGAGQAVADADFGYGVVLYTVGDVIFVDANRNGVYEPGLGERPIPGVRVTLRDASGAVAGTDVTDANGQYRIQVPAGMYTVEVDPPNFITGGALVGFTATTAGRSQGAVIAADNFDLDFGFVVLNTTTRAICSWWSSNTTSWPLQSMTLGGQTLNQVQLLDLLNRGNLIAAGSFGRTAGRSAAQQDISVQLAWALIGSKLNVGAGNNFTSVQSTMVAADAWLASVGIGALIRPGHARFAEGRALCLALTAWNEGR